MSEFIFDESKLIYLLTQIKNNVVSQEEKQEILARFDGRSFKFVTQMDYDLLTEEEKSNDSIIYFITDSKPVQADWDEMNPDSPAYIKNKATKLSQFENDLTVVEEYLEVNNLQLQLTNSPQQYVENMIDGTTVVLPNVSTFTEIHLYFNAVTDLTLILPNVAFQKIPEISAGNLYEFIFTYIGNQWACGFIEYANANNGNA